MILNYIRLYVYISKSCSCRHIHCGIYILRMNDNIQYICKLLGALIKLFFLLHLKQEHEERERFLHHLRTYKYCGVNAVILLLYKIHNTVLNPVAFCYYNVLTVNILLYYVISFINREVSVFVYASFAS